MRDLLQNVTNLNQAQTEVAWCPICIREIKAGIGFTPTAVSLDTIDFIRDNQIFSNEWVRLLFSLIVSVRDVKIGASYLNHAQTKVVWSKICINK